MFTHRVTRIALLSRLSGAAAVSLIAVLALSQSVLADSQSGTHGDYLFTDTSSHPGATCTYVQDKSNSNKYWLAKITATAPSLWWPDQDSSSNKEHGKVGSRFLVQYSSGGSGHTRKTQSPIEKATAYEDSQHPYGSSTKAPLAKQTVAFNGKSQGASATWRIVVNAFWYKSNGKVLGNVNHTVQNYLAKLPDGSSRSTANPYCAGLIQFV